MTSPNFWMQAHVDMGGEVAERHSWQSMKERWQKKLKLNPKTEKKAERVKGGSGEGGAELAREGGGNRVSNGERTSPNVLVTREGGASGDGDGGGRGRVLPDYVPITREEEVEEREEEREEEVTKVGDGPEEVQDLRNGEARWVDVATADQVEEGIFYLLTLVGACTFEWGL